MHQGTIKFRTTSELMHRGPNIQFGIPSCIACHRDAHDGRLGVDFVWAIPFKAQPIGGRFEPAQTLAPTRP